MSFAHVQTAVLVKKRIADVYLLDGAKEQVMRAERNALLDPTAEECGSLIQRGCVKIRNLADMQLHFGEFIDIPTALYAAEIRRTAERLIDEVQAEHAGLHDLRIRVARRTERYADHRRIAVDDARPSDRDQVVSVKARLCAAAGEHDGGNRRKKGCRADGAESIRHGFSSLEMVGKKRGSKGGAQSPSFFSMIHGKSGKINKKIPFGGKKQSRPFVM